MSYVTTHPNVHSLIWIMCILNFVLCNPYEYCLPDLFKLFMWVKAWLVRVYIKFI